MRLDKIKLVGFKSFVDSTTVSFPSDLVAVVGPNGCGKSNIIDAVRWVMGESSAKTLRGESMADVIFNGSSSRKPVGQAMVELVFDNSDATIGGEYASFSEIAIRRAVTRDGQSNYYLNNSRCRRKDITDIFLGTGLGPRSYSIIEQGMISRLIEAKPEEFRVFLEEAAGISKYKERRRETETRIRHTRENLDRLNDLREELEKQINRLQRQSRAAARYKTLKQEERLASAQLMAMNWQSLHEQFDALQSKIKEVEIEFEALVAEQRAKDADIEKFRVERTEANDAFNQIQQRFYAIGADIAKLEQTITHHKERFQQLEQDQQQLEQDHQTFSQQLADDTAQHTSLTSELEQLTPEFTEIKSTREKCGEILEQAETAMREWQASWDAFNEMSAQASETAQVEQTHIQHIENQIDQINKRTTRLKETTPRPF